MIRVFAILIGIVFIHLDTLAQSVTELTNEIYTPSPQAQAALKKLRELTLLPPIKWKVYVGDLAHGEKVDLDDRGWERLSPVTISANKTAWYRGWVEIPDSLHGYDLTGSRVLFRIDYTGSPSLVYVDGRLIGNVDAHDGLDTMVLLENVRPGQKALIAVKQLTSSSPKRFRELPLRIQAAPARPSPGDLLEEFVSTATFLGGTAGFAEFENAISGLDFEKLGQDNQQGFDESLREIHKRLEVLRPQMKHFEFHLTGNSHIDAAWKWPWTETVEVIKRTFGTATQIMREYPDYTFTQSSAQYSEWIADKAPVTNAEIKNRVKEGRWELVGGMWVEPDLNMPDGESLVRQLLVGKRYFRSQYGVNVQVGWNPDSFGYSWQLPQIYKKSGIDYFVTAKLNSNETHKLPLKLFWWESPDGSKVLTYLANNYGAEDLSLARLAVEHGRKRELAPGLEEMWDLYGVGDHGGGPTRVLLEEGQHWQAGDKIAPKFVFGTAGEFFDAVRVAVSDGSPTWNYQTIANGYKIPSPIQGKIATPVWRDELYYEFHRGVFTTQANHKRNMREAEEQIINSEKYASLAWLAGDKYPATELTEAWKKVLFNQFHDLAAGSGIGVIYKDAQKDYDQVRWATNEISANALQALSADVNTRAAGDVPILVFNPLAWTRSGRVTLDVQMPTASTDISILQSHNKVVPSKILSVDGKRNIFKLELSVPDVPSLGYKVLHAVPGTHRFASDLKVQGFTLQNANLRVSVDPRTGCITSVFDKRTNFESIAKGGCGNQLQTFADNPKCCDAWNIDPGTLDHPVAIDEADSVELVEFDPLRATIRVERSWQNSKFSQDITLYAGADQVEISNDIDWHEKHTLLKASFSLAATGPFATYEIPYGTIERPTTRNNSWEQTRFENAALRWVDLGDGAHGFSLINESKYGYDAVNNLLRLSLLRSPTSPDPDADQGHHHFTFSLYPHTGDWRQALTERRGYEYNYKLTAMQVQPHTGALPIEHSFVTLKPENVVLTALKKAEDSDALILRAIEWEGKNGTVEFTVPKGAVSATLTNLMEKEEGTPLPISGPRVWLPVHPYEILTLRIDYRQQVNH